MPARRQNDLNHLGNSLARFAEFQTSEGVGAPIWGTKLSLPELLDTFLTDGKYDVGKHGWIVVPADIDFVRVESPRENHWRIEITAGKPYFEGKGFVKLLDTLGGMKPTISSIDIHDNCRSGEINIDSFMDWPFEIRR